MKPQETQLTHTVSSPALHTYNLHLVQSANIVKAEPAPDWVAQLIQYMAKSKWTVSILLTLIFIRRHFYLKQLSFGVSVSSTCGRPGQ